MTRRARREADGASTPDPRSGSLIPARLTTSVVAVLSLLSVAWLALRMVDVRGPVLIALASLAPLATPAAALALVVAIVGRRLRVVAAAALCASTIVLAPFDAVVSCGDSGPDTDDDIVVLTANVHAPTPDMDGLVELLVSVEPDVVLLQETTRDTVSAIAADPRLDQWPYRSNDTPGRPFGVVTWSRWPVTEESTEPFSGVPLLHSTVSTPTGSLSLTNVHTTAPLSDANAARWRDQLDQLAVPAPAEAAVVAGDFNATADHRAFRDVLDLGWGDARTGNGCGLSATWPTFSPLPILRLDHVLTTDAVEVRQVETIDFDGSDHRAVVARLRLRDA